MLTEVEEELEVWSESTEEKESTQPYHVAVNAVNCLSNDLGEKTVLVPFSSLVQACVKSPRWQERHAGFMVMGLIAEACKESMAKNMTEAMTLACQGVADPEPRVRYAGLSCLGLLLTELAPKAQKKFHGELLPVLLRLMREEQMLKLQTHAVSTVINFVNGLSTQDDEEESEEDSVIKHYSNELFQTLVALLKRGIE